MDTFTFIGPGGRRTVRAKNEYEARHKAMELRWGPPSDMYKHPYRGLGLYLVETQDYDKVEEP